MTSRPQKVELRIAIRSDGDLLAARQQARQAVFELGFNAKDVTSIVTSISELIRNMLIYAGHGELIVKNVEGAGRRGIQIIATDDGPGIPDIRKALMDGYSTSGGLGMGLPGVRRLMDEFEIRSEPKNGTVVSAIKWLDEK